MCPSPADPVREGRVGISQEGASLFLLYYINCTIDPKRVGSALFDGESVHPGGKGWAEPVPPPAQGWARLATVEMDHPAPNQGSSLHGGCTSPPGGTPVYPL